MAPTAYTSYVLDSLIIRLFCYNTDYHYGPQNECYNEVPVYNYSILCLKSQDDVLGQILAENLEIIMHYKQWWPVGPGISNHLGAGPEVDCHGVGLGRELPPN